MANESPVTPGLWPMPQAAQAATEYLLDAWQRTILTWDVLRERGNQYLEHAKSGNPPVLVFDYETVVDGRELAKPANYALVRVKPPAGYPAADPKKRPFVVIDPRAGHGPGIGGFKIDSEIGIALKAGHPCYFVMFYPQPVPGQTIESVCSAEAAVHAQGERAASGRGRQAVRHRQLPGRLGADDARRARAEARRPDPARRLADLLLGGRRRQEPDALLGRTARRHLDGLAARATSATASSTAPISSTTSRTSTRRTPTGPSSTTSTRRSTPSASGSSSSRSGGAATTS